MHVELIYCAAWNYEPQAVSLAEKLMKTYKQKMKELKLVPADGGRFELSVNGKLIYSKLQTGKFPDEAAMVEEVGKP